VGRDRKALEARVDALAEGAERRAFASALSAWSGESGPDGYRSAGDPARRTRIEALLTALGRERRGIAWAAWPAALGLAPGGIHLARARHVVDPRAAILGAGIAATVALGTALYVAVARRRLDRIGEGVARFDG
jgi:hypothetical protein